MFIIKTKKVDVLKLIHINTLYIKLIISSNTPTFLWCWFSIWFTDFTKKTQKYNSTLPHYNLNTKSKIYN